MLKARELPKREDPAKKTKKVEKTEESKTLTDEELAVSLV